MNPASISKQVFYMTLTLMITTIGNENKSEKYLHVQVRVANPRMNKNRWSMNSWNVTTNSTELILLNLGCRYRTWIRKSVQFRWTYKNTHTRSESFSFNHKLWRRMVVYQCCRANVGANKVWQTYIAGPNYTNNGWVAYPNGDRFECLHVYSRIVSW